MSKQSKESGPTDVDPPRTPQVSSGVQTSLDAGPVPAQANVSEPTQETILASGDTVIMSLNEQGNPVAVLEVVEGDPAPSALADTPAPNAEYGFRPEPIPGPSVEEIKLMSVEGYPEQPTSQELIMKRAQAQADAIIKAAEDSVAAMDKAEAEAREAATTESG